MTIPTPNPSNQSTPAEDTPASAAEIEAAITIPFTKVQDEASELAALLEFMTSVIPEGMRTGGGFSEGIINGFTVMLTDAEARGKRLKEWLND